MPLSENPFFLKKKIPEFHVSPEVVQAAKRTARLTGEKAPQKPEERIQNYLDRLQEILDRDDPHDRERGIEAMKRLMHRVAVIKPQDIPESYWNLQRRIAREQGHGDIEITPLRKQEQAEIIRTDQKSSLDAWADYLSSSDAVYPDWLKYWAMRSVMNLGEYDKEKKQFSKRRKDTVKPFPDLNQEALSYVLDALEKKYSKKRVEPDAFGEEDRARFEQLLQEESFAKLYAWAIEKVTPASKEQLEQVKGRWVRYPKDSDHMPLVKSLQGHGTGWCTAGESTAKNQLQAGDFHVFYSEDAQGNPVIPRVAIRMEGDSIAEVRGIAENQNLDPYVGDIVQAKLKRFPDGELYEKKMLDMKRLTSIEKAIKAGQELGDQDLRFLYEIDDSIQGFGYQKDPRIKELKQGREARTDLAKVFDCRPDQISFTPEEALKGDIVFHEGSLGLGHLDTADGLKLPRRIRGYLSLAGLVAADGLVMPEDVGGSVDMTSLVSAKGVVMPRRVGGMLDLRNLKTDDGLVLPEYVCSELVLKSLEHAKKLVLPRHAGFVNLDGLVTAENLVLPNQGLFQINLNSLKSAVGLVIPDGLNCSIEMAGLESAEGLRIPEDYKGHLDLSGLTQPDGLAIPESFRGGLSLSGLVSGEGLRIPEGAKMVFLPKLKTAKGLILPERLAGQLNLGGLLNTDGLRLPREIGSLMLYGLKITKGLVLPEIVHDTLDLSGLPSAEGLALPHTVGRVLHLSGLLTTKGLELPEHVGLDVTLNSLSDSEIEKLRVRYPELKLSKISMERGFKGLMKEMTLYFKRLMV
jgi:hypothetical protein